MPYAGKKGVCHGGPKNQKTPAGPRWRRVLLVLAAALLLTWYMERTALEQERDRMNHIAQSVGSETYETLLSEMGKTRVLEAYLIQTGGFYEGFEKVAPILLEEAFVRNVLFAPGGVVEAVYPLAGNENAVGLNMNEEGAGNLEAQAAMEKANCIWPVLSRSSRGAWALPGGCRYT